VTEKALNNLRTVAVLWSKTSVEPRRFECGGDASGPQKDDGSGDDRELP
jgi:hypothetical protein